MLFCVALQLYEILVRNALDSRVSYISEIADENDDDEVAHVCFSLSLSLFC